MVHSVFAREHFLREVLLSVLRHQVMEVVQRNVCVEDPETQTQAYRHKTLYECELRLLTLCYLTAL